MKLYITSPAKADAGVIGVYRRAFREATELYLVSAYLTAWTDIPKLNRACKSFTMIIGKDFGITRKAACNSVVDWLPKRFLSNFMVADGMAGFHPKALFWKDSCNGNHMLVGSSNMTEAAMSGNVEANVYQLITRKEFDRARLWVGGLAQHSVPVAGGWLARYREASKWPSGGGGRRKQMVGEKEGVSVMPLTLPDPTAGKEMIGGRKSQIKEFEHNRRKFLHMLRRRVAGKTRNVDVYNSMLNLWGIMAFQSQQWTRSGRRSNWKAFARAFLEVCDARDEERDEVVRAQKDLLKKKKVPTRGSVFAELLCHYFPDLYPVLNEPVGEWAKRVGYRAPRGASEGNRYLLLAKTLRAALAQKPRNYPAKNLAELDIYIWAYIKNERDKKKRRRKSK